MAVAEVVLVQNDPPSTRRLEQILAREDLRVTVAPTAQRGISAALRRHSQAIVVDVELPDLSGFQVCQVLKQHPVTMDIPVVMLVVGERVRDTLAGLRAGADVYISKGDQIGAGLLQVLRDLAVVTTVPSRPDPAEE